MSHFHSLTSFPESRASCVVGNDDEDEKYGWDHSMRLQVKVRSATQIMNLYEWMLDAGALTRSADRLMVKVPDLYRWDAKCNAKYSNDMQGGACTNAQRNRIAAPTEEEQFIIS
ncbi:hypothetical protein EG329_006198 [Mollisiaceae sp. DMI_Dod_QoI]|nr:hypothetical protein EG329_006198 [Helotiales sp. DMI_Dod_QoI]